MRKVLLFIPLVLFLVLGAIFYLQLGKNTQYMPSALVGEKVPDFTLVSLETDQLVTQEDLPDGPYLINFWGTWCPACHLEHPFLVELADEGVIIIGIDYKDEKNLAQQWLVQKGNPYANVLMDEIGHFGVDMGVTGAPETFVVDRSGMIVYRHQGVINAQNWPVIKGHLK
ncbi:DsbE family thiol:disulfide interchange protein [Marinomonas primoryensis]|jgi:cytochrome c biogenesis protein CcmG/thiol:disulfide interchange protein DsbE|uniref:Cytochrome c-type biogenesis thiol:disulfide oxidoreductase CcmG/DsbE n=1 Tax=Marinomonas primoryensis TaxID=178399 RepID=A0A859CYV5_9GAMM|nr:DsbE family thiol:disulfide interchange protein [Marinomonas primoryensis]QKK79641.1 cytochrome c-type biogenesis thiol:disulfide oxidoreductase CcmG/DsbE [Marinomonas primoryensis]